MTAAGRFANICGMNDSHPDVRTRKERPIPVKGERRCVYFTFFGEMQAPLADVLRMRRVADMRDSRGWRMPRIQDEGDQAGRFGRMGNTRDAFDRKGGSMRGRSKNPAGISYTPESMIIYWFKQEYLIHIDTCQRCRTLHFQRSRSPEPCFRGSCVFKARLCGGVWDDLADVRRGMMLVEQEARA